MLVRADPRVTNSTSPSPGSWSGVTLERRFVVQKRLATDEAGPHYLAWDSIEDRAVVVQMMHEPTASPEARARFERRAELLARLPHPNLPDLYGSGHHQDARYLVVERLEGVTLAERLRKEERLSVEELVPIAAQLLAVAGYAHARQVLLIDLRPQNILLCSVRGRLNVVKLRDLARARVLEHPEADVLTSYEDPSFGSPELLKGEPCDARSDVYALGVLFFTLLTGRAPFWGRTVDETIEAQLFRKPPRLEMLLPIGHKAPNAFVKLIRRCLEKDPWDRPRDAGEMAEVMFDCFPSQMFVLPAADPQAVTSPVASSTAPTPSTSRTSSSPEPNRRAVVSSTPSSSDDSSQRGLQLVPTRTKSDEPSIAVERSGPFSTTFEEFDFDAIEPPSLSNLRTDALAWLLVSATRGDAPSRAGSTQISIEDALARLQEAKSSASTVRAAPVVGRTPPPPPSVQQQLAATVPHAMRGDTIPAPTVPLDEHRSIARFVLGVTAAALFAVVLGAAAATMLAGGLQAPFAGVGRGLGALTRLQGPEVEIQATYRPSMAPPLAIGQLSIPGPEGVVVIIDGDLQGEAPLQRALSAGAHSVEVQAEGFAPWTTKLRVRSGHEHTVVPELVPLQPTPVVDEAPQPKPAKKKRRKAKAKRAKSSPSAKVRSSGPGLLPSKPSTKPKSSGVFLPTGGR